MPPWRLDVIPCSQFACFLRPQAGSAARKVIGSVSAWFIDLRSAETDARSDFRPHCSHEEEKKRQYNRRILEVEKATFTPLIFSTLGGSGTEADKFYQRTASLISDKRDTPYSDCVAYIRRKMSFCLLRTVLVALRGYRGRPVKKEDPNSDINLIDFSPVFYWFLQFLTKFASNN